MEQQDRHSAVDSTVQLLDTLSRLIRTTRAAATQGEYGLGGTPLGILRVLAQGDARSSDLAAHLQIAPSVVSRALTPLEHAGLMERRSDPDDARATRLGLTAAGRRKLDDARRATAARLSPLLDDWDSADIASLTRLMDRLESTIADGFAPRTRDPASVRRAVPAT